MSENVFKLHPIQGPDGCGFDVYREGDRVEESRLRGGDGLYYSRAKGASLTRPALWEGDFDPGVPVALVPEPSNPADPNAIAIWDYRREWRVGYLSRAVAKKVARAIREERDFRAYVLKVEAYEVPGERRPRRAHLRVLVVDVEKHPIDLPDDPAEPLPDAPRLRVTREGRPQRKATPEPVKSGCLGILIALAVVMLSALKG
ncbi:MAG: HIRAN domain-containing protein [Gemmatimonadota bacterium]